MSIPDDLQQLSDLFERGLLTREQFDAAKGRLLGIDPDAEIPADAPSSSTPQAAIQQPTDETPPGRSAPSVEAGVRAETASWLGQMRSAVSNRMTPVIAFVSENRPSPALAGAVVTVLIVAMLSQPSEPPRPTAAPAQTPQQQTVPTRQGCLLNTVAWIDKFQIDPSSLYRTFGSDSNEARTIAELSNEYYAESFRIGSEQAFYNAETWILSFCRNMPEFSRRVAESPPR